MYDVQHCVETADTNFMSYYVHTGIRCPYCNKYDKKVGTISAVNQHIRTWHKDWKKYGRVPNIMLSWNKIVRVVYEQCPYCGQMLARSYRSHFNRAVRRSCPGKADNESAKWLVSAMFNLDQSERSGLFMKWPEFRETCVSLKMRQKLDALLSQITAEWTDFNVYVDEQERTYSQKLYIIVDYELLRVYVGECITELKRRMHEHRKDAMQKKHCRAGQLVLNSRYVVTCVGGFIHRNSEYDATPIGKQKVKAVEEMFRIFLKSDNSWVVVNNENCKFFIL